jgi:anaerobic magnesium-protoporphyrin IX monomethyl ester cyclase
MKVHLIMAPTNFPLNYGDLGKGTDPPLGILYLASYAREYGSPTEFVLTDGLNEGFQRTFEIIMEERADIVVIREGERTFTELLEFYTNDDFSPGKFKKIDGICFKEGDKIIKTAYRPFIAALDSIPFPARDLIKMENYKGYPLFRASPSTTILCSRGCPFNCTFCSNNVWKCSKPSYRTRGPQNIADEIETLVKQGYKEFFDNSDEFYTRLDHVKEPLREIIGRK